MNVLPTVYYSVYDVFITLASQNLYTQASQTTCTWIITNGSNCGAAKCVGDAIKEGQKLKWDNGIPEESINCIGIAPWGYVDERDSLIQNTFNEVSSLC